MPSASAQVCPQAGLENYFTKYVGVFGVHVFATASTAEAKVLHAANVLAQYLDNDEDGQADDPNIVAAMVAAKASVVMFATPAEEESYDLGALGDIEMYTIGLFGDETVIGYPDQTSEFDASLEEILHLVTDAGWAGAYPADFAAATGSTVAAYMDAARGGHFEENGPDDCEDDSAGASGCALPPGGIYPGAAWYTYDDPTCSYGCMITEYLYWATTSILGGQAAAGRFDEISGEWPLNTAALVASGDPDIYALLTANGYALPTLLPDGDYGAAAFAIASNPCAAAGVGDCAAELSVNPKPIEKYVKKKWKAVRKCAKKAKPLCPQACPVPNAAGYGIPAACGATLDGHIDSLATEVFGSSWSASAGSAACAVSPASDCGNARAKAAGKLLAKKLKRRRTSKMDKYAKDLAKCAGLANRKGACGGQALCDATGAWVDQAYPTTVRANGTGRVTFTAVGAGQAVAIVTLSSPDADWGLAGSESIVVDYSIDGEPRGSLVVYDGTRETDYRIQLGEVGAGQHTVTLKHAKKKSPADRSPLIIHGFATEVIAVGDQRYDAIRYAPVLLGFDDDLNPGGGHAGNAVSDVPLILYVDAEPGSGKTTYSYTLIWSNEDGGTGYFPEVLMAQWGRPHDIETILRVEVSDSGELLSMRYRIDEDGTWPDFAGAFQGSHPVLRTRTKNGLISDDGDSKLRFAIYPFSYDDSVGARQRALMLDPVSYRVGAKELVRENKTESDARPSTTMPSDLRNYLFLELDIDVSIGGFVVRGHAVVDGQTYLSDHGVPGGQVLPGVDSLSLRVPDGKRQISIELPEGTTLDDISEFGLQGIGLMSGTMYYLDGFMLGPDYFPGEHRIFEGALYATGLSPVWTVSP